MALDFEMNPDQLFLEREVYTFLDLLSDIGGLQAVLGSALLFTLSLFNYQYFDEFMASRLYRIMKPDAKEEGKYENYFNRSEFFTPTRYANFKNYLVDGLPAWLVCCKKSRR